MRTHKTTAATCTAHALRAKYWYNNYGSILYIITVSKIAFVTSNDSANYTSLEEELASLHGCERVQPVAENDSNDECCCNIVSLLKSEDCLVYIIWSGSLDTLNGTHNPRLKGLIRLLPTSVDASVMQRLIFLQLGSKGTVDKTVSPLNSIHIFWEVSAEDSSFDAKACGRHVCQLVKERLQGVSRVEGEKLQNNTSPSDNVYLILDKLGEISKKVDKGREESKEGHKTTHKKLDVLDEKAAEINEMNNILTPD